MNDYNLNSLKIALDNLRQLQEAALNLDSKQYDLFVEALVNVEFVIKHKDDV